MNSIKDILSKLKELGQYVIDTNKRVVVTRKQIGETISADYEAAAEALEQGLFLEAFSVADPEMNDYLKSLEGKYGETNQILFYLQYQLNPDLPFSYKDIIYRDVASLGEAILNDKAEKETISEAIRLKLFSYYAKLKQLDLIRNDVIDKLSYAENCYEKNKEISYYLLGYTLSDRKYYKLDGKKFLSVVTLYTYLVDKKKLARFAEIVDQDIFFICWLYALGNAATYEKWLETIKKIDMLDYETFMQHTNPQYVPTEEKTVVKKVKKQPKEKVKKIERVKVEEK